jgi:hypothetical protein
VLLRRRRKPSVLLRPLLYGNVPIEKWHSDDPTQSEPWRSFDEARELVRRKRRSDAVPIWRQIAEADGVESRIVLQAWHFLRESGVQPPEELARTVLGLIAEVAMGSGHDVIAAYRDGSIRYLNHAGGAVIIEPNMAPANVQDAAAEWFRVGDGLANLIGPWERSDLPKLPRGESRIMMLTPGGPRFGQGLDAELRRDAAPALFLNRATQLILGVIAMSKP